MNFAKSELKVRLTLLEQCLGTKPGNDEAQRSASSQWLSAEMHSLGEWQRRMECSERE